MLKTRKDGNDSLSHEPEEDIQFLFHKSKDLKVIEGFFRGLLSHLKYVIVSYDI